MKTKLTLRLAAVLALTTLLLQPATLFAQSTTITYGGELRSAGLKADGAYDVRVGVYDAAEGGNLIGELRTNTLDIVDGKFTAKMDFGESVFTGGDRWLEVGVRPAGVGGFNTLNPRQSVTSIPHAIVARSATSVTGPVLANQLTGLISPFNIGAGTIDETMLASNSVRTDRIADSAVTAEKIATVTTVVLFSTTVITNPTPAAGDQFGTAVAAMGPDRVLIGAAYADDEATNTGAAYLFTTTGTLLTTFTHPTLATNTTFGIAVAALGTDKVLVGASADDTGAVDSGAAYLFSTNGTLLTTITNPTPETSDSFGHSVAAVGADQVLIGAYRDGAGALDSGAAYLFSTNGTLLTTFTNPTPATRYSFGHSVAAVGADRVLIGAHGGIGTPLVGGAAYLYSTNGTVLTTFTSPTSESGDDFGYSVAAVGNDRVLVGAYGAAYLFSTNGTLLTIFTNSTPATDDFFGSGVAAMGSDRVLISAPLDDTGATWAGTAYLFSTNGTLLTTFTNPTPANDDYFGSAVAAVGSDRVVIGSYLDEAGAPLSGAAYVFYLENYTRGLVADAVRWGAVNSTAIAEEAVTATKLANDAVTSLKILDATVAVSDLHFSVLNETFWRLDGNTNTVAGTHFLGTTDPQPLEFRVNNQPAFRITYGTNLNGFQSVNIFAGDTNNFVGSSANGNFIAGGGSNWIGANSSYSVIGGGAGNTIQTNAQFATIPGGVENSATEFSFAAGVRARANHQGSFVWNGTKTQILETTADHQFLIGALGGVGIGTNNPQAELHVRGTVLADAFVGDGSGLSNVTATATITNPIPDFLLPATIARLNTNQTFTASNIFSGVVRATNGANQFRGQFSGIVSGDGAGLTNLSIGSLAGVVYVNSNQTFTASNSFSGVISATNANNQFTGSFTGTHQGNGAGLTNLNFGSAAVPWLNLTGVPGGFADGLDNDTTNSAGPGLVLGGTQFSVNFAGSGVANNVSRSDHTHDATNITSGTLNDSRLSSNVPLRNGTNIFTGTNVFAGAVIATNGGNQFTGQFTGNGAGLSNLNVGSLAGVAYVASNQTFTASNIFAGVVTATNVANQLRGSFTGTLAGNGAGITNLNATNLVAGTVPDQRLSPNVSLLGTNIDSSEIADGTIVNADINTAAGIVDTKLATILTAGKVANSATTATATNTAHTIVARDSSGGFTAGNIAAAFIGNGVGVTNLHASNLTAGTVPDARLSNNLARLNLPNTFTAAQVITNGGQVPLHILGSDVAGTWINLANSSINGRTWNFISSGISNTEGAGKLLFRDPAQGVVMTLSTNGNVGMGTVSPTVKLEVIGTVKATDFIGGINVSNLAGGNVINAMSFTNVGNTFVGNGTGLTNVNAETLDGLDSTAFWKLGGNNITSPTTQFLGSTNNQAVEFRANNFRALRIEPTIAETPNLVGGYYGNFASNGVVGAVIAGGGRIAITNIAASSYSVIGGGRGHLTTGLGATISGGSRNTAHGDFSVVGGGENNLVSGAHSVVGGGTNNVANAWGAVVGGGIGNTNLSLASAINGGAFNQIQAFSTGVVIAGGAFNVIDERVSYSTIIGGSGNLIEEAAGAVILGGESNVVTASHSLAAGSRARAVTSGSFGWADKQAVDFSSTSNNQFLIRAGGGVGINTAVPGGALGVDTGAGKVSIVNEDNLVPGLVMTGGSYPGILRVRNSLEIWPNTAATTAGRLDVRGTNGVASITLDGANGTITCITLVPTSDRNAKENFQPVNPQAVLEKVAALPLREWNFRTDTERTRHLGPMAQDFHAAFGLGTDNRHIATVDADGVALAAIQGLNEKVEARSQKSEDRSRKLEARLEQKETEITELKQTLKELQQLVQAMNHKFNGGAK